MRTHILTALMALVLSACASQHHRDVASVNADPSATPTATGNSEHAVVDGLGSRGDRGIR